MKNLTPMQAAYWTGREAKGFLGNVSAHLYVEFDGSNIDPARLEGALRKLYETHAMLRMQITVDGRQVIGKTKESLSFEVEDLSRLKPQALAHRLAEKRESWTSRSLDLASGETSAFGLSLLPDGASRLHVDTDMAAIDPPSFCLLTEDLARYYEKPSLPAEPGESSFFDWLDAKADDADLHRRQQEDKRWWQERLDDMPPAPDLPVVAAGQRVKSGRLAAYLSPAERRSLEETARRLRVTVSALMLGLFAAVVGGATGSGRFRLNVPMFWRAPYTAGVERLVGDFSSTLILAVDLRPGETYEEVCKSLAGRMLDLLTHSAYPGVSVMRDLSRHQRSLQSAPIVFTSGLGLPGRGLFSERVRQVFGSMNWAVSQGPQVALDAQVAELDDGILLNWDIRYDALPEAWVDAAFKSYERLARKVAADPRSLGEQAVCSVMTCGSARRPATYTEDMLLELLNRLAPGRVTGSDADMHRPIRDFGLGEGDLAAFVTFLNRYIPSAAIAPEDIGPESTTAALASLINDRSGKASDSIARAFLQVVGASSRISLAAQPAE